MAMRVEQAGKQRTILAVEPPVGPPVLVGRGLFALPDEPPDLAVRGDGQPGETDNLSLVVERNAVDVVDKAVRESGGAEHEEEGGKNDSAKVTKVPRRDRKIPVKRGDCATNGGGGEAGSERHAGTMADWGCVGQGGID